MLTLEERAQILWPDHPGYQAAWVRIVRILGDRWLLAKNMTRSTA